MTTKLFVERKSRFTLDKTTEKRRGDTKKFSRDSLFPNAARAGSSGAA
jgi:hypothetical protein